jgi:hypothetical protein
LEDPKSEMLDIRKPYEKATWINGVVDGFQYVVAETTVGRRQHRRVLGASKGVPGCYGKPLLYVDSYEIGSERESFVYTRHTCVPEEFFKRFNLFLEVLFEEAPELRGRKFPVFLAINGKARMGEIPVPYTPDLKAIRRATFFRLDLPFGASTVEFGKPRISGGRELDELWEGHELSRGLESPLAGFDFTEGDLYKPLLLQIHWARDLVPLNVLEAIVGEITEAPIPA